MSHLQLAKQRMNLGRLLPLRSPKPLNGGNVAPNLLDHHKANHPDEPWLKPSMYNIGNSLVAGYDLQSMFVRVALLDSPPTKDYVGNLLEVKYKNIADVAALALEQAFGKAEDENDAFLFDWGMPYNINPGRVFWDVDNDRIIAKTKEGFVLSLCGSNVVEGGIYLTRMYKHILSIMKGIPEGIQFVEAKINDNEAWSIAASPLIVRLSLPQPLRYDNLTGITIKSIDNAINNRINIGQ